MAIAAIAFAFVGVTGTVLPATLAAFDEWGFSSEANTILLLVPIALLTSIFASGTP